MSPPALGALASGPAEGGSSNSRSSLTSETPCCRFCGRALTAFRSVARGYGEECGRQHGLLERAYRPAWAPFVVPKTWRRVQVVPAPAVMLLRGEPRSVVRRVTCPECGAGPDARCVGSRGQLRTANHMARTDASARVALHA